MSKTKKYLGKIKDDYSHAAGESIYLEKHSWDCNWYWGFGYISNGRIHLGRMHTHFDSVFLNNAPYNIEEIFKSTKITQDQWWTLRDLFIQAYALKECAKVYHYGGHQITKENITDIIKDEKMENRLNQDLKKVLNKIWEIVNNF